MNITIRSINDKSVIPGYATPFSAGADLYSTETVSVKPGETAMIHTGLCMEIPEGYAGFIFARSGMAVKRGLAPANKVGVIDSDYRGEIIVALYNQSEEVRTVSEGERIAQIVFLKYEKAEFVSGSLTDTERGSGGFGSTGSN